MTTHIGSYVSAITTAWCDFRERIDDDFKPDEVMMWTQTWSDTGMGFGGMAGQAVTEGIAVVLRLGGIYFVYHGGKFAYRIDKPTSKFVDKLEKRNLPGRSKYLDDPGNWDKQSDEEE